ncbi:zinc finger, CCHC-type containing protein [Tanacetum coccineum]
MDTAYRCHNRRVDPTYRMNTRDENQPRTLGDYSKPSHEGYRNTIVLSKDTEVSHLRSDTIRLVQNGCAFHRLRSKYPNQHLKDFLKITDSIDLHGSSREITCLRLFHLFFRDQARNWLERVPAGFISTWEDLTSRFLAMFFPPERTTKHRNDILMFQQHHGRLRKLGACEAWETIDDLAQYEDEEWDDLVFPGKGSLDYENANAEQFKKEGYLSFEIQHQEAFEGLVLDFILDQDDKIRQLEEYMGRIRDEYMQLSLNVCEILKEEIRTREYEHDRPKKIQKITRYPDTKSVESYKGDTYLVSSNQERSPSIRDRLSSKLLFVGYVRKEVILHTFWPSIGDDEFVTRRMKARSIRDPRVKSAHRCIATTIAGRKDSTNQITINDLFFLYCIYAPNVYCNIPFWLCQYLNSSGDGELICEGMYVTRLARCFGILTPAMIGALGGGAFCHSHQEEIFDSYRIIV